MAFHYSPERVSAEARQINFGRLLLGIVTVPFYVLGWVVAKILIGIWLIFAHSAAATRVGYKDAMRGAGGPAR
jgi:hypothetical protein